MPRLLIFFLMLLTFSSVKAQADSVVDPARSRKILVCGVTAAGAAGSLVYLQSVWYSNYQSAHFHFFNDNGEWLQMDKAGHLFTSYQVSRIMMDAFSWARFNERQKLFVGGSIGFVYLTAIEVMDGFSTGWGFSWGDELADAAGTAMAISQETIWKEQRFMLKFSYAPSGIARYNPSLLGENKYTRVLKDYNAQTYWLSFSPFSFSKNSRKWSWLCFSAGYGATGMTGGHENTAPGVDDHGNPLSFERQRLFYLSLDVDFTKIKTRSRFLNGIFSAINILKVPAPTLVMGKNGLGFAAIR